MKKRMYIGFIAILTAVFLIGGTPLTVFAATTNGYYTAEQMRQFAAARQKALDNAIASGKIPKGTTVDDCYFSTNKDGTITIELKAEIDAAAAVRKPADAKPSAKGAASSNSSKLLSADDLEAYAQDVFALVNKEREKAGVAPLDYDYSLQDAAMTRADECASVNSLYVNGKAHTRPDGSRWFTVLGVEKNYNYGENAAGDYRSPKAVVKAWMDSSGHKANILREDYCDIGIGVSQTPSGEFYWIQIFYRP